MTHRSILAARMAACLLGAITWLAAGCAHRPPASPTEAMHQLNEGALDSLAVNDAKEAKQKLLQAVLIGKEAGLSASPEMAKTYANLGTVYQRGLKDRAKALQHYTLALRIDPHSELPKDFVTPELEKAFATARARAKKQGRIKNNKKTAIAKADAKDKDADKPVHKVVVAPTVIESKPQETRETKATKTTKTAKTDDVAIEPVGAKKNEAKQDTKLAAKGDTKPEKPEKAEKPDPKPSEAVEKDTPAASDDDEPKFPVAFSTPLVCPNADEAPPATDIVLRCAVQPGVAAKRVLLNYRTAGSETFTPLKMTKSKRGWWQATVPASDTTGRSLQYYVAAESAGGKDVANNGVAESPNILILRADDSQSDKSDDPLAEENPLEVQAAERASAATLGTRRGAHALFIGIGAGSGYGWHPSRSLDRTSTSNVAAGFSPGTLFHVLPEIGYQFSDSFALTLQSRHQFSPDQELSDPTAASLGPPARTTHALLLRAYAFRGEGKFRLFATGTVGGGQGFRLVIRPVRDLPRTDTVRGGPVVLGPGAGFLYHLSRSLAWTFEARALVGVPDFAALAEVNTGAQISF